MNKAVIAFVAGAAIGSVVTWQFVKKKYEQMAQEAIEETREFYANKKQSVYEGPQDSDEAKKEETPHIDRNKPDILEYASKISELGYRNEDEVKKEAAEVVTPKDHPYTISPDEFAYDDEYTKISLMHYADGVLCDDNDVLVDNLDEIVGADYASHFGEYDDDCVYIRNDARRCDYEILRSIRTYKEILREKPYKAEV